MGEFGEFYRESRRLNDWRYECARDIGSFDCKDFNAIARAYYELDSFDAGLSGSLGRFCGGLVSYLTNFVPLRSSIDYADSEIFGGFF